MRRREIIKLIGGGAVWPSVARAEQAPLPLIAVLASGSPDLSTAQMEEFRAGLKDGGFVDGQNVTLAFRWARGNVSRLGALATELIGLRPAVIAATGGNFTALTIKAATTTIPVVFTMGDDPVRLGIVASLNRPGGNLTGASFYAGALGAKRLELVRELMPQASSFAILVDPTDPQTESQLADIKAAADAMHQRLSVFMAKSSEEIVTAFAAIAQQRVQALVVGSSPTLFERMQLIAALALRHDIPACYYERQFVQVGGLMSYGARRGDAYRQAGVYAGRILKGEKPGNLPVVFPSKFELVINLNTAKAMGIALPPTLLGRADEVIE
jgi:putative tryptophan/tyrosine transport system substrate-binding protein